MRLLAVDTSTWWGGAALLDTEGGVPRLIADAGARIQDSHASRLLPLVDGLLAQAGWSRASLDAYAAARGPGSFTGIRVALGVLQGLALASGRPCLGIGTLDAMAESLGPAPAPRVPLLDAGRQEAYGARFDAEGSPPRATIGVWVGDPALALEGGPAAFVFGSGAVAHQARLRDVGYRGPIGSPTLSVAAGVGRIALARLAADPAADPDLAPLYVRPADAEIKLR